jgi:hypothetical protein
VYLKMKKTIFLFTSLLLSSLLYAGDFDITQYGAIGDGKTLNTIFIQKAIDECNKSGGGKVTLAFILRTMTFDPSLYVKMERILR